MSHQVTSEVRRSCKKAVAVLEGKYFLKLWRSKTLENMASPRMTAPSAGFRDCRQVKLIGQLDAMPLPERSAPRPIMRPCGHRPPVTGSNDLQRTPGERFVGLGVQLTALTCINSVSLLLRPVAHPVDVKGAAVDSVYECSVERSNPNDNDRFTRARVKILICHLLG